MGQVLDHFFGVFGLSGSRLTSNQHRLILAVSQHVAIGSLSDSPQMRRDLISSLSEIHLYYSWSVDWVSLVRIDDDTKET